MLSTLRLRFSLRTALPSVLAVAFLAFLVQAVPADLAAGQGFPDLPSARPGADAVAALAEQGVMRGLPDGLFHPDTSLSRSEAATVLTRMVFAKEAGRDCIKAVRGRETSPVPLFTDVPRDSWMEPELCLALGAGWISGYRDGTFRPGEPVDLSAVAKLITRAFMIPVEEDPHAQWYEPPLRALAARNAVPASAVRVDRPVTRLEMAEMVYRVSRDLRDRPAADIEGVFHGSAYPLDEDAQHLLSLLNARRSAAGLAPLQVHAALQAMAATLASDLASRPTLSHVSSRGETTEMRLRTSGYLDIDMATCSCVRWSYRYGENATRAPSADMAVQLWMGSPVHRQNILTEAYRDVGIARVGETWVVDFGRIVYE